MKILSAASIICLVFISLAKTEAEAQEECCQPGRIESAKHLIAQSEDFKLKASQYHLNAKDTINNAKKLKGQAQNLKALSGAVNGNSAKEYKANLDAFRDHVNQYRAHLEKVEKELGFCKESEAAYQAQLKEYSLHVEQFHMPNIRPPHICGRLNLSERQSSQMANSMREDQMRVARSEAQLAQAENRLDDAMQASMHSDGTLYRRSQLAEEERKLAGEFASVKTEYELLKMQHSALLGAQNVGSAIKTVRGKLK